MAPTSGALQLQTVKVVELPSVKDHHLPFVVAAPGTRHA